MNTPSVAQLNGFIDLDLPTTKPAPLPNFKAIAEKMIAMGWYVHPVPTGEKRLTVPNWQNLCTRDLSIVAKWAEENPHYNCALVGKEDGCWAFDDDDNILAEYESVHGAVQTYRVRSVSGLSLIHI